MVMSHPQIYLSTDTIELLRKITDKMIKCEIITILNPLPNIVIGKIYVVRRKSTLWQYKASVSRDLIFFFLAILNDLWDLLNDIFHSKTPLFADIEIPRKLFPYRKRLTYFSGTDKTPVKSILKTLNIVKP